MTSRSLLITILIALLSLILTERTLHPLRSFVHQVTDPLSSPTMSMTQSLRSIIQAVRDIGSLRTTVQNVQQANLVLSAQVAELEALSHENETLRSALKFADTHRDQSLISARVTQRSPTTFLQSLTIDKGEVDGVKQNAPVIADGFLIGVVSNRFAHASTVRLITSSDSLIAVLFGSSRTQGLLRGGLDGLIVTDVPLDATMQPNEPVVTSGLGGSMPPNIPVGEVSTSSVVPSNIVQTVHITTPVRLNQLELVFVGQPNE